MISRFRPILNRGQKYPSYFKQAVLCHAAHTNTDSVSGLFRRADSFLTRAALLPTLLSRNLAGTAPLEAELHQCRATPLPMNIVQGSLLPQKAAGLHR